MSGRYDDAMCRVHELDRENADLRAEVERLRGYLDTERKCNEHREADIERLEEKLVAAESRLAAATELRRRWLATLPENKTIGGHLADLLHDSRAFLATQPASPARTEPASSGESEQGYAAGWLQGQRDAAGWIQHVRTEAEQRVLDAVGSLPERVLEDWWCTHVSDWTRRIARAELARREASK